MATPNAQYNVAAPESLPIRIAGRMRRQMFAKFMDSFAIGERDTILDVGTTSDRTYDHSNYLEAWFPDKRRIIAVGIDDAAFLEQQYPGLRFVRASGCLLPFRDASVDYVHSSAVIEHVGGRDQQLRFVAELWRVARKGIFVTTPNRWFPIEFHTVLPLIHWLPKPLFRRLLSASGHGFFAEERNLNLLGIGDLRSICSALQLASYRVDGVSILGWRTNLILRAVKDHPSMARG